MDFEVLGFRSIYLKFGNFYHYINFNHEFFLSGVSNVMQMQVILPSILERSNTHSARMGVYTTHVVIVIFSFWCTSESDGCGGEERRGLGESPTISV